MKILASNCPLHFYVKLLFYPPLDGGSLYLPLTLYGFITSLFQSPESLFLYPLLSHFLFKKIQILGKIPRVMSLACHISLCTTVCSLIICFFTGIGSWNRNFSYLIFAVTTNLCSLCKTI